MLAYGGYTAKKVYINTLVLFILLRLMTMLPGQNPHAEIQGTTGLSPGTQGRRKPREDFCRSVAGQ